MIFVQQVSYHSIFLRWTKFGFKWQFRKLLKNSNARIFINSALKWWSLKKSFRGSNFVQKFGPFSKNGVKGRLNSLELQEALRNNNRTKFDLTCVQLMIDMFDRDQTNTITKSEFCDLWKFLGKWRKVFDRFDADRSRVGKLDYSMKYML